MGVIAPLIPEAKPGGRLRKASTQKLVNAVLFFIRLGAAWRLLPHDLPPSRSDLSEVCQADLALFAYTHWADEGEFGFPRWPRVMS